MYLAIKTCTPLGFVPKRALGTTWGAQKVQTTSSQPIVRLIVAIGLQERGGTTFRPAESGSFKTRARGITQLDDGKYLALRLPKELVAHPGTLPN